MRLSSLVPSGGIRSAVANAGLWVKKALVSLAVMVICLSCTGMASLSDEELSAESGQALFQMDKQVIGGITYYTMNLDVIMDMNLNIASMQLGRTNAVVGNGDTDISATNVSFGCIADASNNCITAKSAGDTAANRNQIQDFRLIRPFMQFAMSGDDNATTRHVVGVRLGAQDVKGPLSFGTLSSFSGYLSGDATINMLGTCAAGSPYCSGGIPTTPPCGTSGGSNNTFPACGGSDNAWTGEPAGAPGAGNCGTFGSSPCQSMGLADASQTIVPGIGAWLHQIRVGFDDAPVKDSAGRTNIPVEATGQRVGYAYVNNINFAQAINNLVSNITCQYTTSSYGCGLIGAFLPLLQGGITNSVSHDIQHGMDPNHCNTSGSPINGGPCPNLSALTIPYNLKNIHQLNIDTTTPTGGTFGLSFQAQTLTYPGYVDSNNAAVNVNKGWALYANKAFTLPISNYTWAFTAGIINGSARNGNIVPLPGPYVNCWGTATFC